jgi:hypothetical protein
MQKVKFEQLKRRCLHDFLRKAREDLLEKRTKKENKNKFTDDD